MKLIPFQASRFLTSKGGSSSSPRFLLMFVLRFRGSGFVHFSSPSGLFRVADLFRPLFPSKEHNGGGASSPCPPTVSPPDGFAFSYCLIAQQIWFSSFLAWQLQEKIAPTGCSRCFLAINRLKVPFAQITLRSRSFAFFLCKVRSLKPDRPTFQRRRRV